MNNPTSLALEKITAAKKGKSESCSFAWLKLQQLPVDLLQLTLLRVLDVSFNELTTTLNLDSLNSLVDLNLANNQLSTLGMLPRTLELLNISHNKLGTNALAVVASLHGLKKLVAHHNEISSLEPLSKASFPRLYDVDFAHNMLTIIPPLLAAYPLCNLLLNNNQITYVSPTIALCPLERLSLEENPLASDIRYLEPTQNVKEFLRKLSLPARVKLSYAASAPDEVTIGSGEIVSVSLNDVHPEKKELRRIRTVAGQNGYLPETFLDYLVPAEVQEADVERERERAQKSGNFLQRLFKREAVADYAQFYPKFAERLESQSRAKPLRQALGSLAATLQKGHLDEAEKAYTLFFDTMVGEIEIFFNLMQAPQEYRRVALEQFLFADSFAHAFGNEDDVEQDSMFAHLTSRLSFIQPSHLQITADELVTKQCTSALQQINNFITPSEKCRCLERVCDYIVGYLRGTGHFGADELTPHVIWVVIRTNLPNLHSNLTFLKRFSDPSDSKQQYFLTQLAAARYWLEHIDASQLDGVSQEEFDRLASGVATERTVQELERELSRAHQKLLAGQSTLRRLQAEAEILKQQNHTLAELNEQLTLRLSGKQAREQLGEAWKEEYPFLLRDDVRVAEVAPLLAEYRRVVVALHNAERLHKPLVTELLVCAEIHENSYPVIVRQHTYGGLIQALGSVAPVPIRQIRIDTGQYIDNDEAVKFLFLLWQKTSQPPKLLCKLSEAIETRTIAEPEPRFAAMEKSPQEKPKKEKKKTKRAPLYSSVPPTYTAQIPQAYAYATQPAAPKPRGLNVGDIVLVTHDRYKGYGTIRFLGNVHFAKGIWCGLELPAASGAHNGTIEGHTYFSVPTNCGMFLKADSPSMAPLRDHPTAALPAAPPPSGLPPLPSPAPASPASPGPVVLPLSTVALTPTPLDLPAAPSSSTPTPSPESAPYDPFPPTPKQSTTLSPQAKVARYLDYSRATGDLATAAELEKVISEGREDELGDMNLEIPE